MHVVAERDQQIASLHQLSLAYLNSTSWRVTAPMRLIVKGPRALAVRLKRIIRRRPLANPTSVVLHKRSLRKAMVQRAYHFYRQHLKGTRLGRLIVQQVIKRGLWDSTELQIAAIMHDRQVVQNSVPVPMIARKTVQLSENLPPETNVPGYDLEPPLNLEAVPGYDLEPPLNLEVLSALSLRPHINILLPSLNLQHMSGGPNTALLMAALLAESGENIRLIATNVPMEGKPDTLFLHMEYLLKRPVARQRIQLIDGNNRSVPIAIRESDIFFATAWWTAQTANYAIKKTIYKTFIYLIQDFEPILHEGSTFQARSLETYGLPHIPLINTRLLRDHLVHEKAGFYADAEYAANALYFEPALDRKQYFPDPGETNKPSKKVLLFYARPTKALRNLFEIGVVALRQAVASGVIDKDNWEIWAMGEEIPPMDLGNGVFVNPLPWLSFNDYAKRVRTADLLLSLMLSPHPSYPPLEMAASGKLVVTNSFSVKTSERLKEFSPNIIAAEPNAKSIGDAIENAADRINLGLLSFDPSGVMPLPNSWDESLQDIIPLLLQRIQILREDTSKNHVELATGLPVVPQSIYENYRVNCLTRRRLEGQYCQQPGLLSFVTSVYDTDPVFLQELANSIFSQDGGMHFEWLILDNGSRNESTSLLLQEFTLHPGVRLERVEENLGIVDGMRYLLEHAHGRYILPLDSDDLIEPDCVHVLTRFIKDNNYPPLLYTDEDKLGDGHFGLPYFKPDWDPVLFLHSCYIAHLCAIDREKALDLALYTNKGAEGCHDWDSFICFMNNGHIPLHIPEVLYSWRVHSNSTSGNIGSKNYISASHRNTLQRFLQHSDVPNVELINSPLFNYDVDWWFRRKRVDPQSMQTVFIHANNFTSDVIGAIDGEPPSLGFDLKNSMQELAALIKQVSTELIHIIWQDVVPDDDEWHWDAMALLELFPDAVMVGGSLHNDGKIVDGPRVFGFGEGLDCPDRGRQLSDPGYGAIMWKPRTVSAVSVAHCVIKTSFLNDCLKELTEGAVSIQALGPWLGALALEAGNRVVYSPFMRAHVEETFQGEVCQNDREHFLSRFWFLVSESKTYSPRLGLDNGKAYEAVPPFENQQHLSRLQKTLLPYPEWLEMHLRRRTNFYPIPKKPASITLITTVYEGTDIEHLDSLAASVNGQSFKALEWIIVAHGPILASKMKAIVNNGSNHWNATVIIEPCPLGIMGAMHRGLESALGEYIVPIDADDLLTKDAIQILTSSITTLKKPELIFSDENLLIQGKPASPYLRSAFDPILNLDSSYIWHLCAINRKCAIDLELYTDPGATWCHDWDSIIRVANSGGRIEHVAEILYYWRQHAGSTTNNSEGDLRSLDSVGHILERQITRAEHPQRLRVEAWPEYRGASELYIALKSDNLPPFILIGEAEKTLGLCCNDTILVCGTGDIHIESQAVYTEVARLFELHPQVGVVGGLVINMDGIVVDACYVVNKFNILESPWLGQPLETAGPYALALKTQSVTATGNTLGFVRVSALKQAGMWPLTAKVPVTELLAKVCGVLKKENWTVAFSPLVRGHTNTILQSNPSYQRPLAGVPNVTSGLVRYGQTRNYQI